MGTGTLRPELLAVCGPSTRAARQFEAEGRSQSRSRSQSHLEDGAGPSLGPGAFHLGEESGWGALYAEDWGCSTPPEQPPIASRVKNG